MTERSARFALPFILPGQAQKEAYHNEALAMVDALLHPAVESAALTAPPADPAPGALWLVAAGATGAWDGEDGRIAAWTTGGWRFAAPRAGMTLWDKDAGLWRQHDGTGWGDGRLQALSLHVGGVQVVGARQAEITAPSGGAIIDSEARSAIAAIIVALRTHGLTD